MSGTWGQSRATADSLPSLRHYLLISQGSPRVEVFTRGDDGWTYRSYGAGEDVALDAFGVSLRVDDLYRDLPAAPPDADGVQGGSGSP